MKVTAMLAWYDEPPELLREAVTSAAVIADKIVAADGAYKLVPDAAPQSHTSQKWTIQFAAAETGMEVAFVAPRIWEGQVAKRDALLLHAVQGSDWVFPLDADWWIKGDREQIRSEMASSTAEALSVRFFTPENPGRSTREIAPHQWHIEEAGTTTRMPLLMRVLGEMRVETLHWVYSGVRPDGQRVGFWGGEHYYPPATTELLKAEHLFEHRCFFREDKQLQRNKAFCEARDRRREAVGYED